MSNKSKVGFNVISSLVLKITTIASGFILPRLIIVNYGSETNGLVMAVTHYLGLIAFLEMGVGAVVQSSLYKALANQDKYKISIILKSAQKFFNNLAYILLIYVCILSVTFPYITKSSLDRVSTAFLIFSISLSMFGQYFFGIVNILLLNSDQKNYIASNVQTIVLLVNTIISVFLIKFGFSIYIVKFISSLIFLVKPIYIMNYVKRNYTIIRDVKYKEEPIQQKWYGFAQHISSIVITTAPVLILSQYGSLVLISIYSLYHLVLNGVQNIILAYYDALKPYIGRLIAEGEENELSKEFRHINWAFNSIVTLIFSITAVLIIPFVNVYIGSMSDTNYILPNFALIFTLANAFYCFSLPYNIIILGIGHFKETHIQYIISAVINVLVSCVCVIHYGVIGVALGLLVSMIYQVVWMSVYDCNFLKNYTYRSVLLQLIVNLLTFTAIYSTQFILDVSATSFFVWFLVSIKVVSVSSLISLLVNYIIYYDYTHKLLKNTYVKYIK